MIDNAPNFFVIGAPKCGTTALAAYLREHEQVFMPQEKEPHFFARDLWQFHEYYTKSLAEYEQLFADAPDHAIARGEASVFYAFSHVALEQIQAFNPAAKLVMMVRNPIDLVYSLHAQYVYNGFDETEPDFSHAWALQDARANGDQLPDKYHFVTDRSQEMVQYRTIGRLGEQVERLYNSFPQEQIKVIVFDDFKADTAGVYAEVLAFLGLDDDARAEFPRINANTQRRAAGVRHAAKRLSTNPAAIAVWRKMKQAAGINSLGMMDRVDKATTKEVAREPLSAEMRHTVRQAFADDIDHLASLLGRDLSHWV